MNLFRDIPQSIKDRIAYLEAIDERDRQDGKPQASHCRQIPPETGRFLTLVAAGAPEGVLLCRKV
jgi:caffeoyl-CoA O-methyltransferase